MKGMPLFGMAGVKGDYLRYFSFHNCKFCDFNILKVSATNYSGYFCLSFDVCASGVLSTSLCITTAGEKNMVSF